VSWETSNISFTNSVARIGYLEVGLRYPKQGPGRAAERTGTPGTPELREVRGVLEVMGSSERLRGA